MRRSAMGLGAAIAAPLVTETMAGTAALLAERGYDTLAVRREVASPGGSTARGLAALERGGLRAAFHDAADASHRLERQVTVLAITRVDISNYVQRPVLRLHPDASSSTSCST